MTSRWRRGLFRQTWHPSFEELMLFLDEPSFKSDKVEAHLRGCWSCRLTREKIDRVISAYMDARNKSLEGPPGVPKQSLAVFEHKLNQLALESGSQALFPVFLREQVQGFFLSREPFRLTAFLACLLLIAFVFFRLTSAPTVSAKQILFHMRQAEAEQMQQTPLPVVYEKLRLLRHSPSARSEVLTWEIWRDTQGKRIRYRLEGSQRSQIIFLNGRKQVDFEAGARNRPTATPTAPNGTGGVEPAVPAAFAELEQVFRSHQANFEDPLSPDSFEAWCRAIRNHSEEASQSKLANGDEAFVLRASGEGPFLQNSIVSAELTIRKRDWQPVEQRLQVKTADGTTNYTLGKVAFEIMALNLLPPSIFSEPTSAPKTIVHFPGQPPAIRAPDTEELPPEGDLIAAELEAWYGLHSVGACLGRPMTVARIGHSQVEVQGIVETEGRKSQILAALRGIPHVTCSIRTVAEDRIATSAQAARPEQIATVESETRVNSQASPQKLAAEGVLEQFFAAKNCAGGSEREKGNCIQQKIAQLSQEVLMLSETALTQAWALRQLAGWYSSMPRDSLRISSLRLLELMARDHLTALHRESGRSQILLTPVLGSFLENPRLSSGQKEREPSAGVPEGDVNWVAASQRLCSVIERTTNLMLGMFVETNLPVTDTESAAKELLSRMAGLEATFAKLEAQVVIELSSASKVVTTGKPDDD